MNPHDRIHIDGCRYNERLNVKPELDVSNTRVPRGRYSKSSSGSSGHVRDTRPGQTRKKTKDLIGLFVDSEIVLSTSYGKTRVFINKTLSTETAYQQDLINRDLLSTRLIVGKVGPGMWCGNCNSTSG